MRLCPYYFYRTKTNFYFNYRLGERLQKNLFIRDGQMASKSTKDITQKHKKIVTSIAYALLFACLALFFFGCEESSQSMLGDYYVTNISSPQAEAYRIIQNALDAN